VVGICPDPRSLAAAFAAPRSSTSNLARTQSRQNPGPSDRQRRCRDKVRRLLATPLPENDMSIEVVAQRLAMSPRTLQRRLAEERTSFDVLREEMRRQVGETYLADPTLSIGELAFLLGFSEPGAFHRAFKRWHKTTPQAFRKRQCNSLQANSA
jgi:AraC-like DNA-binding protein